MADTSLGGRSAEAPGGGRTPPANPRQPRPLPAGERDFRRELSRRLDLFHREVESLKQRVGHLPRKERPEYLELLASLEDQADRLERRVARHVRGSESWEEFRLRAAQSWSELKRGLLRIALSLRRRHPESEGRPRHGPARR